jgi:hypothetical protein
MHAFNDVFHLDLQKDRLLRLSGQFVDALLKGCDPFRLLRSQILRFGWVLRDVV